MHERPAKYVCRESWESLSKTEIFNKRADPQWRKIDIKSLLKVVLFFMIKFVAKFHHVWHRKTLKFIGKFMETLFWNLK